MAVPDDLTPAERERIQRQIEAVELALTKLIERARERTAPQRPAVDEFAEVADIVAEGLARFVCQHRRDPAGVAIAVLTAAALRLAHLTQPAEATRPPGSDSPTAPASDVLIRILAGGLLDGGTWVVDGDPDRAAAIVELPDGRGRYLVRLEPSA